MAELQPPEVDVHGLNTDELLRLFATLEAPRLDEMNGEFTATMLKQRSPFATASMLGFSNPLWPGTWVGKGFRPMNDAEGRGYNVFRHFGKVVQRFPMQTIIAPARFDGKPAYQLVYRAYDSLCGTIRMLDEVRRLKPGAYLGIGTYGFIESQRRIPYPFLLMGPTSTYRGDIGTRRN